MVANPQKPLLAIVGGSKISTKIDLINSLIKKSDAILIAGAMANTFLYAQGFKVGKSLYEEEFKNLSLEILENAKKHNCQIILPKDVVVTKKLEANQPTKNVGLNEVEEDDIIADIGSKTIEDLSLEISKFKTVIWNGPLGAFEINPFDEATNNLAKIIANNTKEKNLISVAGGGDVVCALNQANLAEDFSYISTAGGAFLEWLEGKSLPGVEILEK